MEYVSTIENIADIFTKALGPSVFEHLRDFLNIEDVQKAWMPTGVVHAAVSREMEVDYDENVVVCDASDVNVIRGEL
ncbi:hypothetical protein PHMEG_00013516 [Phytophthora megakarya]|uniref:Uncharacterized protein n=1 Tax=Phytophthora megakarya TaxID=4795 RepID=A0A225W631_9STRA|nr:hypothetical protein PHMEG_00013516 [Phytophthora megakarya]